MSSKGLIYTLYLTARCNLDCVYCYEDKSELPEDLTCNKIDHHLNDIHSQKELPYALFLFGGEPTLRWDLVAHFQKSILQKYPALQKSKRILFTNGLLLSDAELSQISLWKMELFISFDGFGSSSEQRYRKNVRFQKIIKKLFLDLQRYDIKTTIVFTLGKHNVKSIHKDMLFLNARYSLRSFKINTIRRADLSANFNRIVKCRNKAVRWAREKKISLAWNSPSEFGSKYDNYFISSNMVRFLPAFNKAHWEKTKW